MPPCPENAAERGGSRRGPVIMFGSMNEKSGRFPLAASRLELGERHEVGGEPVLEPGEVDQPGGREPIGSVT